MREILFRGKRIDNNEWVCGSFCMDALEQNNGLCGVDGFIRRYDTETSKMQIHEVDRESVGQFIGLTDKNGTKIFEGDILLDGYNNENCLVVFGDGGFDITEDNISWHCQDCRMSDFEVVGNIHDDPELLGGGGR